MTWLVAGLGNPGEGYAGTRHNVGAMVVDELANRAGERFRKARFVPADVAEITADGERMLLVKSRTFMNESGPSYASVARKHDIQPDHVIAAHDELDLAFGALRVKFEGSTAGHHGLDSLVAGLRTPDFYRLRLGIGRPSGRQDPLDFVLRPFSKKEEEVVVELVDQAAEAALSLARHGLSPTQDRYNRSGPRSND
jgi:peptidyl-tRNA hydrolase, PTH1 family